MCVAVSGGRKLLQVEHFRRPIDKDGNIVGASRDNGAFCKSGSPSRTRHNMMWEPPHDSLVNRELQQIPVACA